MNNIDYMCTNCYAIKTPDFECQECEVNGGHIKGFRPQFPGDTYEEYEKLMENNNDT